MKKTFFAIVVVIAIVMILPCRKWYIEKRAEGYIDLGDWAIHTAQFDEIVQRIQDDAIPGNYEVKIYSISEAFDVWKFYNRAYTQIFYSLPGLTETEKVYRIYGDFFDEEDHVLFAGNYFYKATQANSSGGYLSWERAKYQNMLGTYSSDDEKYPVRAQGAIYTPNGHVLLDVYGNDVSECEEYFRRAFLKFQNTILSANE